MQDQIGTMQQISLNQQNNQNKDIPNPDNSSNVDANDITKHPEYANFVAKIKTETTKDLEKNVIARILQKEAKVKTFAELQKYVKLGKEAENIINPNLDQIDNIDDIDKIDQKDKTQKQTIDIKSILKEKEAAINKANEEREKYKNSILSNSIRLVYKELGGVPNTEEMKAEDIAIKELINSGMFEVNDEFEVKTTSGVDIKQSVEIWLKQNHIFQNKKTIQSPSVIPENSNNVYANNNPVISSIAKFYGIKN